MHLTNREKSRIKDCYGEWAVITGACSGIGLALAKRAAEAGLNVVLVARSEDKLKQEAYELEKMYGITTQVIAIDVSLIEELKRLKEDTSHLNVGLFVSSAGYGTSGAFIDGDIDLEVDMLRVNGEATLILTYHFAKRFTAQQRGGIILMSSIVAFQGVPYAAHYAATKAYVQALAEGLAVELKPVGVDVLAAAPDPVRSGFENRANMKMANALNPDEVSFSILKALGKRTTVFPGRLTKLLITGLRTVPRWGKIKIMEKVMQGMTVHQRS